MKKRKSQKSILIYLAGGAALLVSVLFACAFPILYCSWQDGQLTGKVYLETRELLQLEEESGQSAASRLQKIAALETDTDGFDYLYEQDIFELYLQWREETYGEQTAADEAEEETWMVEFVTDQIAYCRNLVQQWQKQGLLPEAAVQVIDSVTIQTFNSYYVYADGQYLPVIFMQFAAMEGVVNYYNYGLDEIYDQEDLIDPDTALIQAGLDPEKLALYEELEDTALSIWFDPEQNQLYYISVSGGWARDYLAQCGSVAAGGWRNWIYQVLLGIYEPEEPDDTDCDLTQVCGASSQEITEQTAGAVDLALMLNYETFSVPAGRWVIENSAGGIGVCWWVGTSRWMDQMDSWGSSVLFDDTRITPDELTEYFYDAYGEIYGTETYDAYSEEAYDAYSEEDYDAYSEEEYGAESIIAIQ